MAYEVLARKWRPQQFADVVGQDHVTHTLRNAIEQDRLAHAYLFVGPRGIGKTSTARILAKALNCEKGPAAESCGRCDPCREIMQGNSLDVLEIDGASNRGIDQVRELRNNVMLAPARGPYKLYIIDEVHMLTNESFNALLKTLEEPPPHVKFIFATTEPHKVPATILSRCQRFDLRPIPPGKIVERLQLIAQAEDIAIDEDALLAIARGAEGGLRDAESALDQLIAFRGKNLREEDVMAVFGLVSRQQLELLAQSIVRGRVGDCMAAVKSIDDDGKDLQRAVMELLEHFRRLLVIRTVEGEGALPDLPEGQLQSLRDQAADCEPDALLRILDIFRQAESELRYTISRRTLLEVAVIRAARAGRGVSIESLLERLAELREDLARGAPAEDGGDGSACSQVREPVARQSSAGYQGRSGGAQDSPPSGQVKDECRRLSDCWHELVEKVAHVVPLVRGYLPDVRPLRVEGERVVLGVDPEYADIRERLEESRCRKVLANAVGQMLGRKVTIACEVADNTSADGHSKQTGGRRLTRGDKEKWSQEGSVRKILETFNGDIIDVRQ